MNKDEVKDLDYVSASLRDALIHSVAISLNTRDLINQSEKRIREFITLKYEKAIANCSDARAMAELTRLWMDLTAGTSNEQ